MWCPALESESFTCLNFEDINIAINNLKYTLVLDDTSLITRSTNAVTTYWNTPFQSVLIAVISLETRDALRGLLTNTPLSAHSTQAVHLEEE